MLEEAQLVNAEMPLRHSHRGFRSFRLHSLRLSTTARPCSHVSLGQPIASSVSPTMAMTARHLYCMQQALLCLTVGPACAGQKTRCQCSEQESVHLRLPPRRPRGPPLLLLLHGRSGRRVRTAWSNKTFCLTAGRWRGRQGPRAAKHEQGLRGGGVGGLWRKRPEVSRRREQAA